MIKIDLTKSRRRVYSMATQTFQVVCYSALSFSILCLGKLHCALFTSQNGQHYTIVQAILLPHVLLCSSSTEIYFFLFMQKFNLKLLIKQEWLFLRGSLC